MDNILAERKFLHDIATPVGTAIFLLDSLLENITSAGNADDIGQAQALLECLMAAKKSIEERRAVLISQK